MTSIPGGFGRVEVEAVGRGFLGLRVLSLESRRAREMAQLIVNNGGQPFIAPSTREVPESSNAEVLKFTTRLLAGHFHVVIFLTGVGTRILFQQVQAFCSQEQFAAALSHSAIVARGPKPAAALRELGVALSLTVPEPNTWREILQALDQNQDRVPLKDRCIAVQEYGGPSSELLLGLSERGANVFPIRVYQWALPDDVAPMEAAVRALNRHEIDVVLFTAAVQVRHLLQIADKMNLRADLIAALTQTVVGSIGPVTSDEAQKHGIAVDIEPTRPKMGFLVKETAEHALELLDRKRRSAFIGC